MTRRDELTSDGPDVLHVDMDCFFVAVEVRDNPALAGKAVVVGGGGPRGVVASASYEARGFGVRSAMPTSKAHSLCPHLVVLSPRRSAYQDASRQLLELFNNVTPLVQMVSIDEAYLDISGAHATGGSSTAIATNLRRAVIDQLGLSCSIGIGRTKVIAKLASNAAKPVASPGGPRQGRQIVCVTREEEIPFLQSHHVRAIPGVGPRTADRLARLGITTVAELGMLDESTLVTHFGRSHGRSLFLLARGIDERRVEYDRSSRSIGHEETFDVDLYDELVLGARIQELSGSVASRCRSSQLAGRTVSIKVRFSDFSTIGRSKSVGRPLTTGAAIADIARDLFSAIDLSLGVRLIGVSISNLESMDHNAGTQLEFFSSEEEQDKSRLGPQKREELEGMADAIRRRFGSGAIVSGRSISGTVGEDDE